MRFLFAIAALCAAAFLALVVKRRLAGNQPQRQSDGLTVGIAIIILWASTMVALARPAPYPPVTPFNGDRYASAHLGPEVTRAIGCPPPACVRKRVGKARYLYPTRKRPPVARQKWRAVPVPAPRQAIHDAYRVEVPLTSLGGGLMREAGRVIGRPAAWCGWWLGQHLGMPLRKLWLARNWASVGSSAGGPAPGVIVVWRHHVGIITGRQGNQWIVKSGNDGRRVRERPRSVAGAIAFRRIS